MWPWKKAHAMWGGHRNTLPIVSPPPVPPVVMLPGPSRAGSKKTTKATFRKKTNRYRRKILILQTQICPYFPDMWGVSGTPLRWWWDPHQCCTGRRSLAALGRLCRSGRRSLSVRGMKNEGVPPRRTPGCGPVRMSSGVCGGAGGRFVRSRWRWGAWRLGMTQRCMFGPGRRGPPGCRDWIRLGGLLDWSSCCSAAPPPAPGLLTCRLQPDGRWGCWCWTFEPVQDWTLKVTKRGNTPRATAARRLAPPPCWGKPSWCTRLILWPGRGGRPGSRGHKSCRCWSRCAWSASCASGNCRSQTCPPRWGPRPSSCPSPAALVLEGSW